MSITSYSTALSFTNKIFYRIIQKLYLDQKQDNDLNKSEKVSSTIEKFKGYQQSFFLYRTEYPRLPYPK